MSIYLVILFTASAPSAVFGLLNKYCSLLRLSAFIPNCHTKNGRRNRGSNRRSCYGNRRIH